MKKFFKRFYNDNRYAPWYDEHADYNTNAKSYYDYLARKNRFMKVIEDFINRLVKRDIEFDETRSVKFTKDGSWIDNGECEHNHYDDIIRIKADVKRSKETMAFRFPNIENNKSYVATNSIREYNDGIFSPDYLPILEGINNELGGVKDKLDEYETRIENNENDITVLQQDVINLDERTEILETNITNLSNAIQKIVDNLYTSGAITSNNINNFNFNSGRNIATGNINLFGGTSDGNSFIRTNNGKTNNDISAGY